MGEQKRLVKEKSREKRRQVARLRANLIKAQAALAATEEKEVKIQDDLARLDDISSRILKREIMALGAFDQLPENQEITVADETFSD